MIDKTFEAASRYLGKNVKGSDFYNPSLLVPIPRMENRKQYNIDNSELPFYGYDVWHAYEFSALCENGMPVTRVLKICYSCESEFIIESKSLKLYLNSFNMSKFGKNINECLLLCKKLIEKDLTEVLKTIVKVDFIFNNAAKHYIFSEFKNLMSYIDEKNVVVERFNETPELLITENNQIKNSYYLFFDSLRSNCRVTHQPDFGDVYIFYKSKTHILEESLVKYLCSFRSEYHFHEECCEMIYKRLYDILDEGDELFVGALYTRRGGIDISPMRMSKNCTVHDVNLLADTTIYARNGLKQ